MGNWEELLKELSESDYRHGGFFKAALDEITTLRQRVAELELQIEGVRRAERERVAEFILRTDLGKIPKEWQGFAADGLFKYAEAIRAME